MHQSVVSKQNQSQSLQLLIIDHRHQDTADFSLVSDGESCAKFTPKNSEGVTKLGVIARALCLDKCVYSLLPPNSNFLTVSYRVASFSNIKSLKQALHKPQWSNSLENLVKKTGGGRKKTKSDSHYIFFFVKHDQALATVQLNIPKINTIIICKIN